MRSGLWPAVCVIAVIGASAAGAASKKPTMSYAEDIEPIIIGRCLTCHQPGGSGYEKSGLDLRTYSGLMKGTKFGPIVVPGDEQTSNLLVLLDGRADKSLKMPHNTSKKLSTCDRDAIRTWIREGALNN